MLIWTPVPEAIKSPFPMTTYTLGGLYFLPQRIMVICAAFLLVLLTHLLLKKTKIGKAMRATFQDLEAASLMGIRIDRIYSFTFVLGVGLAAAAGVAAGPDLHRPSLHREPRQRQGLRHRDHRRARQLSPAPSRPAFSWVSLKAWARAMSPPDTRTPWVSSCSS